MAWAMATADAPPAARRLPPAVVEDITKRREPLPQLVGIYFISPTDEHIKQVVRDFSLAAMPQYRHAHVFFSSKPSSQHLAAIRECPNLVSRLRTLKEVRALTEGTVLQGGWQEGKCGAWSGLALQHPCNRALSRPTTYCLPACPAIR